MTMRTFSVLVLLALTAGCTATANEELATGEDALRDPGRPRATVTELDALVTDINGYASASAWIVEHPRDFIDDLDDRFLSEPRCTKTSVIESSLRSVTRDRTAAKQVRKLGLTYSSDGGPEGRVMVTTHESYHYDEAGKLRVVVVDREEDHMLDEAFMKDVDAHNLRVKAEHDAMPMGTHMEKVALANKMFELKTSVTITQYRLYFTESGQLFAETKSDDLAGARALEFDGIGQLPPTLYGDVFPANVKGTPYLTQLFPTPDYAFRPIATRPVPASESLRDTLVAAKPFDPEASLATKPVCR